MSDAAMKPGWTPRSAWAGILFEGSFGAKGPAGVIVTAREGLGIASLIAPEDGEAALSQAVKTRFQLDLPTTPRTVASAGRALVWAGPGQWLLVTENRAGFADELQALSGLAAIADQSDGRAVLTLSGGKIRTALSKGCMIDLHPSAFPVGSAALTSIAHIACISGGPRTVLTERFSNSWSRAAWRAVSGPGSRLQRPNSAARSRSQEIAPAGEVERSASRAAASPLAIAILAIPVSI